MHDIVSEFWDILFTVTEIASTLKGIFISFRNIRMYKSHKTTHFSMLFLKILTGLSDFDNFAQSPMRKSTT